MKRIILLFAAFFVITVNTYSQLANKDEIIGLWESEDKHSITEIFEDNNVYYAKLHWIKDAKDENGNYKTDIKNPDNSLRNRKYIGLVFIKDMIHKDENEWEGGEIYDPKTGKTYSCKLTLLSKNNLEIRGYLGFPSKGKSTYWHRINIK